MLLCLAMQMLCRCRLHCRCRCRMQRQIAGCRLQMQSALQMPIGIAELQTRKTTREVSNGLRARGAGSDLFNRSRAFRRAWGVGLRALGERAFSEETRPTWWQHRFQMAPKWSQHGCQRVPGGLLVLEPLERLGRPRGGFQWLMGRSWMPLGAILGPKKVVLNGSWPLQEEFQDRFQPSWRPKASQKGSPKGAKTRSQSDSSSKTRFLQKLLFFQ